MAKNDGQRRRMAEQREQLRAQREYERLVAQQQREAERAAAQAARERQAQYLEERQREAEDLTAEVENRVEELASVLRTGLERGQPLDFQRQRLSHRPAEFKPGNLGRPEPEPEWAQFEPRSPSVFGRLFGSERRRAEAAQRAQELFERELEAHRQREQDRMAKLERARQQHQKREDERKRHIDVHNAEIDALEQDFRAGEHEAVERCLRIALESAPLPQGVPDDLEVGYRKDTGQVLVIRELPDTDIIPTQSAFRYIKKRDEIDSTQRKTAEVKQRYADLVAQLALLTLRDVLAASELNAVTEVTVNCHLATTDSATGKAIRPCLLTVSANRADFAELVLDKLKPQDCLRHLNALMSPHPYDVEPVKPLFEPDMSRFRLTDAEEVAAGMDSRTVLTELSPTEFEHLVRELFEAMGMQSWVTQASRDDGVDAVANNPDPVMGGLSVIQAKRYVNVVPADAVRALWGVMEDKKAGTGVLVTTSYFGKASHDFANRNERVRLIEGPELKHLLQEHLGKEVILGAKQRPEKRK